MIRPSLLIHAERFSRLRRSKSYLASALSLALSFAIHWGGTQSLAASQTPQIQVPLMQEPSHSPLTSEQLQQLVAPIALYPDSLVAQILAASTYPEQVVQADRWVQAHPELKGDALSKAVDQQPWDPSVKALVAFPSVLGNMDKNLSWTSSLGDAYYNQQEDVMDAVQLMRKRAQGAGNLQTTPQQTIAAQGATITIEPASPEIIYVPEYDPWSIYGLPMAAWPGWYEYPGIWFGGPHLTFGIGFGVGFYGGFAWGWPHWGFDWHNRYAMYNHNRYRSRSNTFYNRSNFYRGGGAWRDGVGGNRFGARPGFNSGNRPRDLSRTYNGSVRVPRGTSEPQGRNGARTGVFSGYQHGGQTRDFSSRGSGSLRGRATRDGGAPRGGGTPRGRGAPRSGGAPRDGGHRR